MGQYNLLHLESMCAAFGDIASTTDLFGATATAVLLYPCVQAFHNNCESVDLWAAGIILLDMLIIGSMGRVFLEPCSKQNLKAGIFWDDILERLEFEEPDNPLLSTQGTGVQDLLRRILKTEPRNSLSVLDIAAHPWLKVQGTEGRGGTSSRSACHVTTRPFRPPPMTPVQWQFPIRLQRSQWRPPTGPMDPKEAAKCPEQLWERHALCYADPNPSLSTESGDYCHYGQLNSYRAPLASSSVVFYMTAVLEYGRNSIRVETAHSVQSAAALLLSTQTTRLSLKGGNMTLRDRYPLFSGMHWPEHHHHVPPNRCSVLLPPVRPSVALPFDLRRSPILIVG